MEDSLLLNLVNRCQIEENIQSDDSESEVCSSFYSSESDYEPWLEYVKDDGSLFYFEIVSSNDNVLEDSFNESQSPEQSHSQQSKTKLNSAQKIKKWMKARKKKERKSFPLTDVNKSSQIELKDVYVDVFTTKVISSLSSDGKAPLSEKLFGLKLGPSEENYSANTTPCILSVRPNEEIPDVKIGDKVLFINDKYVNMSNLEDILNDISMDMPPKVKLTIASSEDQTLELPARSQLDHPPSKHHDLKSGLLGESYSSTYMHSMPHGIFFLTIENGTFGNDCVLYRYPDGESMVSQLAGMFLTLGHMISDVATPPLLSCSVKVSGELVHIGFVTEEDKIMILVLPASVVSVTEVQRLTCGLAKFLKYLFSSLQKAFSLVKNKGFLDNFFTLYFEHYLSPVNFSGTSEPHLIDILPSAHWFPLPNDIKTEIDDILSELESAEFEVDSGGFRKNRRIFNIFGSCLFYKGYLLCSHLAREDLLDIHSFLHHNHLLELTHEEPVANIIIWRKVFPSRFQECIINRDPEFKEVHGQCFLLIVVMHHSILAVLLDDGGCSHSIKSDDPCPPEPFYVEEVQNTLWILHDYGITSAVEKLLHFSIFPPATSNLLFKENSENSLSSTFTSNTSIPSSEPNVSDHSTTYSSLTERNLGHADGKSDTESKYSNDSNEMASMQNRCRSLSASAGYLFKSEIRNEQVEYGMEKNENEQGFSSLPNLYKSGFDTDIICFESSYKMVSCFGNNIFYYLHMDPVQGVFIAPITPNSSSAESLHKSILNNFYTCCLQMRTVFERSLRNGEINKANIITKYGVNSFLQNAYEQGLLFKCDLVDSTKHKGSKNPSHFWVIGRLFFSPEPREVYICHHDGAAQDVVEMAFRLGFGLSF